MATDFFDEDLAESAAAPNAAAPTAAGESFHERQKRELPEQLTKTGDEIERLKQRQEALERRKQEIIDQRRRVELFEHNRKDLLDKLRRNAVMVVRESEQASRTAALCNEVGGLFSRLHQELEAFAPDSWSEEEYDARLTEALAKVDAATAEYRKAMDQVAAVNWRGAEAVHDDDVGRAEEERAIDADRPLRAVNPECDGLHCASPCLAGSGGRSRTAYLLLVGQASFRCSTPRRCG